MCIKNGKKSPTFSKSTSKSLEHFNSWRNVMQQSSISDLGEGRGDFTWLANQVDSTYSLLYPLTNPETSAPNSSVQNLCLTQKTGDFSWHIPTVSYYILWVLMILKDCSLDRSFIPFTYQQLLSHCRPSPWFTSSGYLWGCHSILHSYQPQYFYY